MKRSRVLSLLRRGSLALAITLLLLIGGTIGRGTWEAPNRIASHLPPPPLRSLGELPAERAQMLLAIEDPRFFSHHGVDFVTPGAGWTTITQALVKVLYFESFSPGPLAKLEQTLLAIGFDASTPKKLQLDLFWNLAYLGSLEGREIIGFPRAAVAYFGRDAAELDRAQYLALVAMPIAPNRYSPARRPEASAERVARIERLLSGRCRAESWRDVEYEACAASR